MTKSAEMLLKKMGEDKSFAEKILSQTEKEDVIEIARGAGIELTMEDIDEINESIVKALQLKNEGELSEEEMENVAGGYIIVGPPISPIGLPISTAATTVLTSQIATISTMPAPTSISFL
ncbi:MAG: Nif11-like leader peptide family natural product precursor [Eubacteriales bacterium]|nr:Nif11-like leader peptide family natural product precursor [Eubacteriales bacterium]